MTPCPGSAPLLRAAAECDGVGPGPATRAAFAESIPAPENLTGSPRIGVWTDEDGFLHQELTADGRYDETRGGRPHAYQGRYWVDGDRIDYLDDLGFWAHGEFQGDELHTRATW